MNLTVSADPAAAVAAILRETAERGGHVALSGGSSPRPAYEAARDADWTRTTVWFVDDRAVPPDDERSNYGLVREALDPPNLVRIRGELGAAAAADEYHAALEDVRLDLVVLGMGPDGHTASLFPGKPELDVTDRRAVAVPEAGMEPYVARVTLTLPMLNAARRKVFLVTGESKRAPLQKGSGTFSPTPGQKGSGTFSPTPGQKGSGTFSPAPAFLIEGAEWFVDEAAAP